MMQDSVNLFKTHLEKPGKALLALHVHPDPDSVGSNLALADVLREYGHKVDIVSSDEIPQTLSFLPGFSAIRHLEQKEINWGDYDTFWALDMSSSDRHGIITPIPEELLVFVIDHHMSNQGWGTHNIVDSTEYYPSTCSMLLSFFNNLKININVDRATMLLTGIAGDTGFFQYGTHLGETMRDSAQLFEAGADYHTIRRTLLGSIDINDLSFMSKALAKGKIYKEAFIVPVSKDLWQTEGSSLHKNEFVVYYLSKIEGTKLGVLIIEEASQTFRLEFRSRDVLYDVSKLAVALGGGGHMNAAGATLRNMTLTEAIEKVKSLL